MSLISIYNAYWQRQQNTIKSILRYIKRIIPTKITIEDIAKESPNCVKISDEFKINLEKLLIYENYRYIIHLLKDEERLDKLEERIKNYDYLKNKEMFLLKQAANRIENRVEKKDFYYIANLVCIDYYLEKWVNKFNELKQNLNKQIFVN
ncbi:MAG: hypothetical protein ACTSRZ_20360 [Promethearchaeota archaeon]